VEKEKGNGAALKKGGWVVPQKHFPADDGKIERFRRTINHQDSKNNQPRQRMNLSNLIQSQLSPQTIGQIGNTLGESPGQARSALGAAIPALLGALVSKASTSSVGANDVFNLVKQNQSAWSDSGGNWLSSGAGAAPSTGTSLLSSLFGSKLTAVADFIANHTGIKGSSAGAILGMAAPLIMSVLGKQVSSQGLGASGLAQLLSSQAPFLKEALPAGLGQVLGIDNILSGAPADATKAETPLGRASDREAAYQQKYGQLPDREALPAGQPRKGSALKWAVPLLLAVLFGGFLLSRARRNADMGGTSDRVLTQAGQDAGAAAQKLSVTAGGIADQVSQALARRDFSGTIDMSSIAFDDTGHLAATAGSRIQELTSVLTANPSVKISITGFGASQEEGLARANAIKSALTDAGISGERIQTNGKAGTSAATLSLMP
jgi:OmpA-OmpF porin, OOP family